MSDLPSHPETGSAGPTDPASGPAIGGWSRRRTVLVIASVVGVLVLFAALHLTGVIGGGEGH
jgi:hypothetical protein